MSNVPEYTKTVWEDSPSEETPINAENLNKIENQVESLTNHVIEENLKIKLVYKGEVALLANLPTTGQKVGDYYIVIEKGVPYLWDGDSFNPQVIIPEMNVSEQSIGTLISSAAAKVTPDVDDAFGYSDSEDVADPNILKKLTWGNLRGSLATFFEGIFALVLHGHSISDITNLQSNLDSILASSNGSKRNLIINGNFSVNQRARAGTVVLTAGQYGHDRWKAGASGCTYTFVTTNNITVITITAGTLIQVIEGLNLESGDVCLSWVGTSQGKIGAGSYDASGIVGTAVGGTNLNIEFNVGTLSKVSLVKGSSPQSFALKSYTEELRECQRYYYRINATQDYGVLTNSLGIATSTTNIIFNIQFPVTMRTNPILSNSTLRFTDYVSAIASTNVLINSGYNNTQMANMTAVVVGAVQYRSYIVHSLNDANGYIAFDAEL